MIEERLWRLYVFVAQFSKVCSCCPIDYRSTLFQVKERRQEGENPLPDPTLTQVYDDATWRHYATMYIILEW